MRVLSGYAGSGAEICLGQLERELQKNRFQLRLKLWRRRCCLSTPNFVVEYSVAKHFVETYESRIGPIWPIRPLVMSLHLAAKIDGLFGCIRYH